MKYEICIQLNDNGTIVNSAIAWTDVRTYAKLIVDSLNLTTNDTYVVLVNGEIAKDFL